MTSVEMECPSPFGISEKTITAFPFTIGGDRYPKCMRVQDVSFGDWCERTNDGHDFSYEKAATGPRGIHEWKEQCSKRKSSGGGPDPSMSDILLGILVAVVVSLVIYGAFRARNAYICKQREDSDNNNVNQNN